MAKVSINGVLFDKEDARISVYDHGLLYGDGVFEGIRVYAGQVFRHTEHLLRLYESARAIRLEIPIGLEQLRADVEKTVAASGLLDAYIRLVVTRGSGTLGLDIRRTSNPQIIIIVDTISLYPVEYYEKGLKIITASTIRNHPQACPARIKSLNYLNNILAKIEGTDVGCEEALMLNHLGHVAECTGDNVFILKRGVLKTPDLSSGILEGVTRNVVMELAAAARIPVQETTLIRHDIYTADEFFLTGSAAEIIPVVMIDGRPIGDGKPGPITRQLQARYKEVVRM
jgi:branched-chain amino acid aminotransferase